MYSSSANQRTLGRRDQRTLTKGIYTIWIISSLAFNMDLFILPPYLASTHLLLLHLQFHLDRPLLVLAPLVLEPHADYPWRQSSHLHQLLLHQGVRSGIGIVAGPVE